MRVTYYVDDLLEDVLDTDEIDHHVAKALEYR
jgi:hypothetical protein